MLGGLFCTRLSLLRHILCLFVGLSGALQSPHLFAAETAPPQQPNSPNAPASPGQAQEPQAGAAASPEAAKPPAAEEEDYSTTPYTQYGEFNEVVEEEHDTRFFQYGRFFGVSFGLGMQIVDGNRGALWQGGFPAFDLKMHYWFDFNFALDLGIRTAMNSYTTNVLNKTRVDVNMMFVGVHLKYYFDTRNLSAPISFANPYLLAGGGYFSKTENSVVAGSQDNDSSVGIAGGAGLEFVVSPKKTYFALEGKVNYVTFKDTLTNLYQPGISVAKPTPTLENLTGVFYTITGNIMLTW